MRDRGSRVVVLGLLVVGIIAAFAAALTVPGAAVAGGTRTIFWAGIALGIVRRWHAIRVLGRYFSPVVAVRSDHQIVKEGPYHYVRHPSYRGALLSLFGLGLALTNWLCLLVLLICAPQPPLPRTRGRTYTMRDARPALRRLHAPHPPFHPLHLVAG